MPGTPGQTVFQLRIELDEVMPAVWRRLLVPGGIRLAKLHHIFQAAMGWTNSHLHAFTIGDDRYGMHLGDEFLDEDVDVLDEANITVIRALGANERFEYEYDFGDCWDHAVAVEERFSLRYGLKYAVCLERRQRLPTGGLRRLWRLRGANQRPRRPRARGARRARRVDRWSVRLDGVRSGRHECRAPTRSLTPAGASVGAARVHAGGGPGRSRT